MLEKIKSLLIKILPWLICIILAVALVRTCNSKRDIEEQANHNIAALNDSVRHYTDALGEEVATKAILIGDMKTLEMVNDSLAEKVKAMGIKKPDNVVYINNDIIHEKHDTAWVISAPEMEEKWDFSDKWRELGGNVYLKDSVLGMTVDKDIVHVDFTLVEKDGRAYVSSSNPYVKVNDIQGIVLPKPKQKHWHIGPQVGVGLGEDLKVHGMIGIGVQYSILSW